jgi:hypothetical protein
MPRLRSPSRFALFVLALACASDPGWQRPGSTSADLAREKKECFAESGNTSGVMNWETSRYVERCLEARGWTRGGQARPAAAPPPESSPSPPSPPSPPASPAAMSFDECFERCRELTDRSKEACFDVCLDRR